MSDRITSRGPDDSGVWVDPAFGIALGHRRLSILDLSPSGHQPMASGSERFVIVFNGEIYNFLELRKELEKQGCAFRGHSDTEVMLALFDRHGIRGAVERLNGMFAFAVWDRELRTLSLARDRAGEKPLYFGFQGDQFFFASELKAIVAHPRFKGKVSSGALARFFKFGYVPGPLSIFEGISKLEPGTLATLELGGGATSPPRVERFWSIREVADRGLASKRLGSDAEVTDELERLLRDAVQKQMLSDVPLGAFLSGGVDSSLVVALMQAESRARGGGPVKTFTIGFEDPAYNEAPHAKAVAEHLGTKHTELYVTADQTIDVIPKLPGLYDEPFADSSQIPTYLVSGVAKRDVTVCLSGDAGDEVFGGYNRYFWANQLWNRMGAVPGPLREAARAGIRALPASAWNGLYGAIPQGLLPPKFRFRLFGDKMHKLSDVFRFDGSDSIYGNLISIWKNPQDLVLAHNDPVDWPREYPKDWSQGSFTDRMMLFDFQTYLPDDILVKVDRAAMGVSLETRVPFLDHRVVEFAWSLPPEMKIRDGRGKWILRQILDKHVPRALIERPKMGFGIPVGDWLRTRLRDWAEPLLDEKRIREEGYLNSALVTEKWRQHLRGDRNWQADLWAVLMFQSWLDSMRGRLA